MFDKNKDILPVGSVVLLKNGNLRIMIIGLFPLVEDKHSYYDYCGVLYPEGLMSLNTLGFFNRESISKVFSIGLFDDGVNNFMNYIKEREEEIINNPEYKKKENDDLEDIFKE